jgi:hypothetical protein
MILKGTTDTVRVDLHRKEWYKQAQGVEQSLIFFMYLPQKSICHEKYLPPVEGCFALKVQTTLLSLDGRL